MHYMGKVNQRSPLSNTLRATPVTFQDSGLFRYTPNLKDIPVFFFDVLRFKKKYWNTHEVAMIKSILDFASSIKLIQIENKS